MFIEMVLACSLSVPIEQCKPATALRVLERQEVGHCNRRIDSEAQIDIARRHPEAGIDFYLRLTCTPAAGAAGD